MPPKRMTANPLRPARHRPGKPAVPEIQSDSNEESEDEEVKPTPTAPKPAAYSFPKTAASRISANLKQFDLNARNPPPPQKDEINEDEFETEESGGSGSDESSEGEDESSSSEESSSEDEAAKRKLLRPVFMKKDARKAVNGSANRTGPKPKTEDELWAEREARRKERADALLQEELDKQAQARAAGKKYWDDEDNIVDDVDDTDDLDLEAELAAWKLRELRRVKRERDAPIAAEKEREEVERRRNLSKEEREREDQAYLDKQREEREGKGKMGYMQKYFHKGAYFTDDLEKGGLAKRDIMGGRYEDDVSMREALPEYMQIRDMTKLGKKGRTRYKDMRSEDTGRWGDFMDRKGPKLDGDSWGRDERFRPDYDREHNGPSGANASALGERKRPPPNDGRGEDKRARVE